MLKSIRDITDQTIDRNLLEEWYSERDKLKKKKKINKTVKQKIEIYPNKEEKLTEAEAIVAYQEKVQQRVMKQGKNHQKIQNRIS